MKRRNWKLSLGVFLIIFCVPFFLLIPVITFLNIDSKTKITLSTISLIIGEVLFWTGGILVGKELFSKYKSYFNPNNWFKKKSSEDKELD